MVEVDGYGKGYTFTFSYDINSLNEEYLTGLVSINDGENEIKFDSYTEKEMLNLIEI
jgi:hypothetical protein